jgi:uncharacterized phage protein (TIGR02220 family)
VLQAQNGDGFEQDDEAETEREPTSHPLPFEYQEARELIAFLNLRTGRAFPASVQNLSLIDARLREGWSFQQCKTMMMRKWHDWGKDERMAQFVRPRTLFNRTRCAEYMAQIGETPEGDG